VVIYRIIWHSYSSYQLSVVVLCLIMIFFLHCGRYLLFGRINISDIRQGSSQYLSESCNSNVHSPLRQWIKKVHIQIFTEIRVTDNYNIVTSKWSNHLQTSSEWTIIPTKSIYLPIRIMKLFKVITYCTRHIVPQYNTYMIRLYLCITCT